MSSSRDNIQVAQLGGNKIASTQIINNAILNAVLMTFQRNDQSFKQAASGIYQYGPKSFIRQLQTATGVCDMTRSLTALTEDVRNGAAGASYQLSGYCYNKPGYKVWCNVAPQNAHTVSAETSSLLASLGYDLTYGVMSSDLTCLSGDQVVISDPEIYSFDGDASSPNQQDYFTKTVTANSYLLSTESEKAPSNWRQQLHTTFDYEPVSAACKAYFAEHQRDVSPYDSMGCLTHYVKNSHLFTEKAVASLSNFQSMESNGFADTIFWYWHGTRDVNVQISSPGYACAATSAKPTGWTWEGYQMTTAKLNSSYSNLENLIGISETKKVTCTFILYASGRFDLYADIPNVTTYIPEISFKNKISGTRFTISDASGSGYSPNNNLSVIVFPNLKLKNSLQEIQFPLHTITQGYKTGTLKVSGSNFVGYQNEPAALDATTLSPGNYNAVPPYIKNAGDKLIIGPIQYTSSCIYIGPSSSSKSPLKIKRSDIFETSKPFQLKSYEWQNAKVGVDPQSDTELQYTINVSYDSPSGDFVGCDLMCITLDYIGYSSEWTRTRVKFSWKGLVEAIMSERSEQLLKYSVQIGSAVANAKTIASDRYQVGADTALYPESKIFDVNDSDMIVELFNSDNQTLRISGTIAVEQ